MDAEGDNDEQGIDPLSPWAHWAVGALGTALLVLGGWLFLNPTQAATDTGN